MVSDDKPIRLSKPTVDKLKYTKTIMMCLRHESVTYSQVIDYALEYLLKNDEDISLENRKIMYNVRRGRLFS